MSGLKILFVGESWIKHTIHMKGFDQFHSTEYEEGASVFLSTMGDFGHEITYIRAHEVGSRFPTAIDELEAYDVVVISDIGANSFLLTDEVFLRSEKSVNRLDLVADYVRRGGGLVMIGGYLTFSGIDAKGRWGRSPLADVLPVTMFPYDDRVERPEGVTVTVTEGEHPALGGVPTDWPQLLGYNQLVARPDTSVLALAGADPMVVVGEYGAGRSVAFASDLAPHWAPPEFLEWAHYGRLWSSLLTWAARSAVETTADARAHAAVKGF